jgi:hypothetical protein
MINVYINVAKQQISLANDLNKISFIKSFSFSIFCLHLQPVNTGKFKKPREEVFQRYDHYQH